MTACTGKLLIVWFMIFCLFSGNTELCAVATKSISRDKFKKILSAKGLKFVHQNICGLEHKFDELQEFVVSHSEIDIISLSETHLQNDSINSPIYTETN